MNLNSLSDFLFPKKFTISSITFLRIKIKFTFLQRGKFCCSIFSSAYKRTRYNRGKCFQGFIVSEVEGLAILR